MPERIFVYDVAEIDEVFFNEEDPATPVSILFKLPTGKLFGVRLGPAQIGELETALEAVREELSRQQPKQ